jgi:hypothetical protein
MIRFQCRRSCSQEFGRADERVGVPPLTCTLGQILVVGFLVLIIAAFEQQRSALIFQFITFISII